MVRWRGVTRAIIPALLLFSPIVIAIVYVVYSYIRGYASIDSLLAIVILFQTYIVWIQVEIALRQTEVFKTEYEPTFQIKVTHFASTRADLKTVSINNVGTFPAYNVMIGLVDRHTRKPIEEEVKRLDSSAPTTLAPNDSTDIFCMSSSKFYGISIEMNILYNNVMNEIREAHFAKFPKTSEFMLIYTPSNLRQGILLKSLENFKLAYQAMKWRKYFHEKRERK